MRPLCLLLILSVPVQADERDRPIPDLPNPHGVASPFAGVSHNLLIVAGGANFPDHKPWEGGKKIWHDTIYGFDGKWKTLGKLPRALAYGVSITHQHRLIGIGGSDSEKHYPEVFALEYLDRKLKFTELPSLPEPRANAAGVLLEDTIYLIGGQEQPSSELASKTVYRLNLASPEPRWKKLEPFPGVGRIFPVVAAVEGKLYIVSGAELILKDGKVTRRYLKDGYCFDPRTEKWQALPELSVPVVAAPSPAPSDANGFYLLGGDDGEQVSTAPDKHRGFSKRVIQFQVREQKWRDAGEILFAPVTVPVVKWDQNWLIPSGEIRPGVRTPRIETWTIPTR
jgi:N-acetylneuraminic acid mutarotase